MDKNMKKEFKPLVSIIMPVYNGEKYVKEAIESALAQTYKNIEIVVVNDGSIDDSEKVILSFGDRVRYFKKENGGVATALNLAIEKANGEYISWLSHDDLYTVDKVEKEIQVLSSLENKDTIIYSDWDHIDEKGKLTVECILENNHKKASLSKGLYSLLNGIISGCTLLIKKSIFEEFGLFDSSLLTTQDYALWFKMFNKYPVKHISEMLVSSRVHKGQDSNSIRAFHLREEDELWLNMISSLTDEQWEDLFKEEKVSYLEARAKVFDSVLFFNTTAEALFKLQDIKKKNLLLLNPDSDYELSQAEEKYNVFSLKIEATSLQLFFGKYLILTHKLKSPIGFEYHNMFLQNEVTLTIEKIFTAFEIDVFHMFEMSSAGFDIVRAANNFEVPTLYTVSDLKSLWMNQKDLGVKKQIGLFAKKFIFPCIDKVFIEKNFESEFKLLINDNDLDYVAYDKKDDLGYVGKIYPILTKKQKKSKTPDNVRKLILRDLLSRQRG